MWIYSINFYDQSLFNEYFDHLNTHKNKNLLRIDTNHLCTHPVL